MAGHTTVDILPLSQTAWVDRQQPTQCTVRRAKVRIKHISLCQQMGYHFWCICWRVQYDLGGRRAVAGRL